MRALAILLVAGVAYGKPTTPQQVALCYGLAGIAQKYVECEDAAYVSLVTEGPCAGELPVDVDSAYVNATTKRGAHATAEIDRAVFSTLAELCSTGDTARRFHKQIHRVVIWLVDANDAKQEPIAVADHTLTVGLFPTKHYAEQSEAVAAWLRAYFSASPLPGFSMPKGAKPTFVHAPGEGAALEAAVVTELTRRK